MRYEWGSFWTTVGNVEFRITADTLPSGEATYLFRGQGKTLPFYDPFFKVRDLYRSRSTQTELQPLRFQRKVREGGTSYFEDYRFERSEGNVIKWSSESEDADTIPWEPGVLDVLTAVYYCRSMDLDAMETGDTTFVRLVLGDKVYSTNFVHKGMEIYQGFEGKELRCHYIEPELIPGSIFKEGDRMKVLVTADRRKVPVYVESEIQVGEIKVRLEEMEGTIEP